MNLLSIIALLFLVFDPIGNIPAFVSFLTPIPQEKRIKIVIREFLIALVFLFIFLFTGPHLTKLLRIHHHSIEISGAIILFLISLKMIFSGSDIFSCSGDSEPFIVPLAIPLISGPSAFATIIILASTANTSNSTILYGIIITWLLSLLIMTTAIYMSNRINDKLLLAGQRLMGMLLTMISVEMFLSGLKTVMNNIQQI